MVKKRLFDTFDGKDIYEYTIVGDITVCLITLGARIMNIYAPDKSGNAVDVALNMVSAKDVLEKSDYMGATIGRCGNRIGQGSFEIGGKKYEIWHTDGAAHLHGGRVGFDKKIFSAEVDEEGNGVTMRYTSPDGEEGYPGQVDLAVRFTVDGAKLIIEYFATAGKDTVLNLTNHAYFNMNGESDGSILDNVLQLNAYAYLPTDKLLIPTGEVKPVDGTPFDFRVAKPIGKDIESDDIDLKTAGGYDHNFCLSDEHFATVYSTKTGIKMDCYTDRPGVQFYAGNFLVGNKGKSVYGKRSGFCLETQVFPDAVHHPEWVSPILKKGENYYTKTVYAFSVNK